MTDLTMRARSDSQRPPMAPADAVAYAVLAAAALLVPVATAYGVPGSSPIGIATMVATTLCAVWLILPVLRRTASGRRAPVYPDDVVASVAYADVVGFRNRKGRAWTVRFADGTEQSMPEYEFQDVMRSASDKRKVAAVQRLGPSIYVQHLADGPFEGKRSRTEIFHCSGFIARS